MPKDLWNLKILKETEALFCLVHAQCPSLMTLRLFLTKYVFSMSRCDRKTINVSRLKLNCALLNALCAKRGGVRKMLQSAKTFTYIWSIGWSYDMFNLVGHHFPYFMAILLPFYGFFWPKMAIFGHRQSQQPQIGWTLGEQGWTLFSTSGGISLGLLDHTEMSLGGPRTAQNGLF